MREDVACNASLRYMLVITQVPSRSSTLFLKCARRALNSDLSDDLSSITLTSTRRGSSEKVNRLAVIFFHRSHARPLI